MSVWTWAACIYAEISRSIGIDLRMLDSWTYLTFHAFVNLPNNFWFIFYFVQSAFIRLARGMLLCCTAELILANLGFASPIITDRCVNQSWRNQAHRNTKAAFGLHRLFTRNWSRAVKCECNYQTNHLCQCRITRTKKSIRSALCIY